MKRFFSLLLVATMLLTVFPLGMVASAECILPDEIYLAQETSVTCTLASATMMLRSRMYLSGNDGWRNITESVVRSIAWTSGGLKGGDWDYVDGNNIINVHKQPVSWDMNSELKSVLNNRKEGIVLYCGGGTDNQHAVFVTDYVGDTYYCADPAGAYSGKRIPLADSLLGKRFGSQENILKNVTAYWYIPGYRIEASNPGYLMAHCTKYPCAAVISVTKANNPFTLPCNSNTAAKYGTESIELTSKALSVGDTFVATALYYNSENHYWYETKFSDGTIGYVYADKTELYSLEIPWIDGGWFYSYITGATPLNGTVTTTGTIDYVQAFIYYGTDSHSSVATSSNKVEVNSDTYPLNGSTVDNTLHFEYLSEGDYTLSIEVEFSTYYSEGGKLEWTGACARAGSYNFMFDDPNTDTPDDSNLQTKISGYISSPSEGQVVPKSSFPVIGTVTSERYALHSVHAYLDDTYYANWVAGNSSTMSVELRNTDINWNLDFAGLSDGEHNLAIYARDVVNSDYIFVCEVNFYSGENSSNPGDSGTRHEVKNNNNVTGADIVAEARKWANSGATYWSGISPWVESVAWRTGFECNGQLSFDCSGFVGRVLNDCGFRGVSYTPSYGTCVLSQTYGNGYIGISIEELVSYGTDITDAVWKAKEYGDYSDLYPGDIIGWAWNDYARHILIYAGLNSYGQPTMVEFTGSGYRDRVITEEYQTTFQFGARLVQTNTNTYTISYNANGGTGAPSTQTKTDGVDLPLSSQAPYREGYVFVGWSENRNATHATYERGGWFIGDYSTTLYAVWIKVEDAPTGNNLAYGMPYYVSGSGAGFGSYTANLTDGRCSDEVTYDENWFAFYYNPNADSNVINAPNGVGHIIIDLATNCSIDAVAVHLSNDTQSAISMPTSVEVYVSSDGNAFSYAGAMELSDIEYVAYWSTAEIECDARYVMVEVNLSDYFAFVDEIAVYGREIYPDEDYFEEPIDYGDVNDDGAIDQFDYILVKRHYFETRYLEPKEKLAADVNGDGVIDQFDYILIKRHYFGTYTIA